MRLTADIIKRAVSSLNPVEDREIVLRGYKISKIENLGVTEDLYDTIDLSENEILRLENFPKLRKLKTLLLACNWISRISPAVASQLSRLEELVLTSNRISSLTEIDALSGLPHLQVLVMKDNPVTRQNHYRLYVIHKIPSLRVLDFSKVKQEERESAARLFSSASGQQFLTTVVEEGIKLSQKEEEEKKSKELTQEQRMQIVELMNNPAITSGELDKIDRLINTGRIGAYLEKLNKNKTSADEMKLGDTTAMEIEEGKEIEVIREEKEELGRKIETVRDKEQGNNEKIEKGSGSERQTVKKRLASTVLDIEESGREEAGEEEEEKDQTNDETEIEEGKGKNKKRRLEEEQKQIQDDEKEKEEKRMHEQQMEEEGQREVEQLEQKAMKQIDKEEAVKQIKRMKVAELKKEVEKRKLAIPMKSTKKDDLIQLLVDDINNRTSTSSYSSPGQNGKDQQKEDQKEKAEEQIASQEVLTPPPPSLTEEEIKAMKVVELKESLKSRDVDIPKNAKKDNLIQLLKETVANGH